MPMPVDAFVYLTSDQALAIIGCLALAIALCFAAMGT